MRNALRNDSSFERALADRNKLGKRTKRKRQYQVESLESRTLLSYTFSLVGQTATVSPVAATGGPILIDEVVVGGNPLLEWSQDNGATFSTNWDPSVPGANTLPATTASTIDLTPTTGAGSSITLGDLSSAASNIFALFNLGPVGTPANVSLTIDDRSSTHAAGSYDFYSTLGTITGPGGALGGINYTSFGPVNSYLIEGGPAGNTFNIHSTFSATTTNTTIIGGAGNDTANVLGDTPPAIGTPLSIDLGGGTNTVHVGNGNISGTILAPVTVNDTGGTTTLDLDNTADTTATTATITSSAVNIGAAAAVNYGSGVTALNINGGAPAAGVTYNINSTAAGTTTTITGGANHNLFNLSNAAEVGGLNNLPGPVVVNGGASATDVVTLEDSSANFNDNYTITDTTVSRGVFGGLTYGGIGTLTLNAENNLGTNGNNTIDINNTANGVTTNVNGQGGQDIINVNGTGALGTLNVTTGTTDGSTVNVVADNEPVNVTLHANDFVNIGSTGGAGTMAGILGAIVLNDPPLFYTLTFHDENDATAHTWTLNNDDGLDTASVAFSSPIATTTYKPGDLNSPLTVDGGSGGNTFIVNNTTSFVTTDLNTGTGADTVNVFATGTNTLNIDGQAGADTVTLGGLAGVGMQDLNGTINVTNDTGLTNLILDDSQDTTGRNPTFSNNGTTTTVTGLSPATITYTNAEINTLTVKYGSGLNGMTVDLSNDGLAHNLDLSSNGTTSTLSDELGNLPNDITYVTASIASLTIDTDPTQNETLNINFGGGGNPIPTASPVGLIFNADGSLPGVSAPAGVTHALNIFGQLPTGAFASETHNANDPAVTPTDDQYGSIFFTDAVGINTGLDYTGLAPINDTAPAVLYTFNDFADDQSFTVSSGTALGLDTIQFANTPATPPPTFETTNVANKANIVFNTPFTGTPLAITGVVNIPTTTTGVTALASLTFNTDNNGDKTVSFVATPPGVVTSFFSGLDVNVTNVTGKGVAAGTTLLLNGGGSINTLNYNAGGLTPTVTSPVPGEVLITLPGFGSVLATDYQVINITNAATSPPVITPGPAVTINSVEGFQLVNALVGTFTFPLSSLIPSVFPVGTTFPAGLPASDFTATINWGDGTSTTAGTITQDASNPSVYDITGTHIYTNPGTYTIGLTVNFVGGPVTGVVGGIPVTVVLPASSLVFPAPAATANVTDGVLAVTAFPIVGTEGAAIAAGPIATFIDAGGADLAPVTLLPLYTAAVNIFNSSGALALAVPAADITITQVGSSDEFTVSLTADAANKLPEEGTYQVVVTVTDPGPPSGPPAPFSASGASLAVIADAALTPGVAVALPESTGVSFTATVGNFIDANAGATTADFTASIDWGDGSPNSIGTIGGAAGAFTVGGTHIYAKPGTFDPTVVVTDDGGSTITLTTVAGSAAVVTVTDLAVTGATKNFTATEGEGTGLFVLATFTDPNTLATVADVTATLPDVSVGLPNGGWGDGTPPAGSSITLVVQQIGGTAAGPIFEVLGSHTYAEETGATPDPLTVVITTLGGVSTTLTGGVVTVLDAPLTSSNGTTITGTEGITTGPVLLGTFTDANQGATSADFTTAPGNGGSVVVNWGDGSLPQTLTAANLAAVGTKNGVIFSVTAAHIYPDAGNYAITVTVTDDGGSVTVISPHASIADAALTAPAQTPINTTEAAIYPLPVFAPPIFSGQVATFTDGNPLATLVAANGNTEFTATIDWGDGTSPTAGTVTQPGGIGTAFDVSGSHTYADAGVNGGTGHYAIQVFVTDVDGSKLTVNNAANVADIPIVLTGILNPASDSGLSNGVTDVTKVTQPDFFGTSQPFSHVSLFATAIGSTTAVPIGQVQAGSDGSWNIRSGVTLADGHYTITASAIDQFGETTTGPVTITSNLLIDTVGPVITGMFFNRLNGEVDYTILDPSPGSGVSISSLLNSANYELTKVHANKAYPGKWIVTNVTETAGAAAGSYDVAVTFNNGNPIRGGFYLFTIRDSSNGNSSVQDMAENHLDGVFTGSFPSGNGVNGSDFVAELSGYHNKIFAPQTIVGTANKANGGAGGAPVGAVHSGNFSPVVPVGGGSVFGNDPKHLRGTKTKKAETSANHKLAKTKAHVVVKTVAHHAAQKTGGVQDAALKALLNENNPLRRR